MKILRKLYIIGSSSFGRELECWLDLIPRSKRDWLIKGYLDIISNEDFSQFPTKYPLLGSEDNYKFDKNDYCVIAVADPKTRELIYNKMKGKLKLYTYIAPNAIVGNFSSIGEGSIICPNCVISVNVRLEKSVIINIGTQIGHDVVVGNFSSIMANVDIGGRCTLGNSNYIGSNAVIIPNKKIGNNVKIGAGSVVIRNINDNCTVFGNPAQIVKF